MERMTDSVKVLTRTLVLGMPIHITASVCALVPRGTNGLGWRAQMSSTQEPTAARYCRFISRHAGAILVAALLLFAGAATLASRLELKTALSELLPSDDPGVIALEATQKRMGDMSLLLIGVRSPDRAANLRYAEMLTQKLLELPKNVVSLATYHIRDLKSFFEKNKWLYVGRAGSRSDPRSPAQRDRAGARTRCSSICPTTTTNRSIPCANG